MAYYFIATAKGGRFVGLLQFDEVTRRFRVGELPGHYIAALSEDPHMSYAQFLRSRTSLQSTTVAELSSHLTDPHDVVGSIGHYASHDEESRDLTGIAGWLILPALGLVLNPIQQVLATYRIWRFVISDATRDVENQIPGFRNLVVGELLLGAAFLVFTILVAIIFFSKSRLTPKLMVAFYLLNAVGGLGLYVWNSSILAARGTSRHR